MRRTPIVPFVVLLIALATAIVAALAAGGGGLDADAVALATSGLLATIVAFNVLRLAVALTTASMLFLAALAVFHLGMVVPVALGLAEPALWLASADPALVTRAVLCVALAVVAYELGCLAGWHRLGRLLHFGPVRFGAPRRMLRWPSESEVNSDASPKARCARPRAARSEATSTRADAAPAARPRPRSVLYSGGLLVATAATVAIVVNVWSIGVGRFFDASYGYALYAATDSRLLLTALYWLLPAAALVTLVGARAGRETLRALVLLALVAVALLWAGDRGGAVSFLSAALVVWTATRGSLPRQLVVSSALGLLLLMPMVATLRQLPRNGLDLSAIGAAAAETSPIAALTEMGGSLRTLVETMRLVPEVTKYRLGGSYLDAALRVIPNVGLDKAEHEWSDPATLPPNHWITYMVAPWAYAAFGGLGFSAIAEPYLNFGVLGVAAYFFALGAMLGWLDRALARRPSRRFLAITAVVFMPLLVTVRNDFHNFLRPAVWGACIVLLVEQVHGDRRARSRASRTPPQRQPTLTLRATEAA